MFASGPHKLRNDAEPFNGAYRPQTDVALASSNTMDTTLSEAPNSCQTDLLMPVLVSERAFFCASFCWQRRPGKLAPPGAGARKCRVALALTRLGKELLRRVVLQGQQQTVTTHGGGFFWHMQTIQCIGKPGVVKGIRTLFQRSAECQAGFFPFAVLQQ